MNDIDNRCAQCGQELKLQQFWTFYEPTEDREERGGSHYTWKRRREHVCCSEECVTILKAKIAVEKATAERFTHAIEAALRRILSGLIHP